MQLKQNRLTSVKKKITRHKWVFGDVIASLLFGA